MLHFSEYHRFVVVRDFALSSLDYKMLTAMYQPMVGAYAISLYYTLYHQLPSDKTGCSEIEQQRLLFLAMELESGERGRKWLIEQTSKLEAVGLLRTSRRFAAASEDYVYEYELFEPLTPGEFFKNHHLTLLLRDKVGKYALFALRDELIVPVADELKHANTENLSMPFYELFRLSAEVDPELEQAFFESAAAVVNERKPEVVNKGFSYAEIIMRFPHDSVNREYVESLKYEPEQLATINYVAKKYGLYLTDVCKLLDEDGVFEEGGQLVLELLQHRANQVFRQDKKRSEDRVRWMAKLPGKLEPEAGVRKPEDEDGQSKDKPVEMAYYLDVPDLFQGECNQHQYNYILRNEPYTFLLEKIFSRGTVPDGLLDTLSRVELNYGLREEVINVLIHFIYITKRSWSKKYMEAIVTDMLGKQVGSFEQAVHYVREQMAYSEKKARETKPAFSGKGSSSAAGRGRSGARQKPLIPVVQGGAKPARTLTDAEREELRRKALLLDGKA
ncbi:replicative DNA helicase loader DnaB [Paenibacillus sp. UNCCL117]|nr:replicative DNA helicase loader DnaB [Paenibacillus sp. cl123]SFW57550.1 replicative DNA helicase loader DnaB [Paenibacillus sp. UNCCL117]